MAMERATAKCQEVGYAFGCCFRLQSGIESYRTSGEGDRFNSRIRKKANKQRKLVVSSFGCGVVVVVVVGIFTSE